MRGFLRQVCVDLCVVYVVFIVLSGGLYFETPTRPMTGVERFHYGVMCAALLCGVVGKRRQRNEGRTSIDVVARSSL